MNQKENFRRPIGYWLKRADELLTSGIDRIQSKNGLSRTEWQILNVIHSDGTATFNKIADALRSYATQSEIKSLLSDLVKREFIAQKAPSVYSQTGAGKELFERALTAQKEFRNRVMDGITAEEYEMIMNVLQKLAENLEKEELSE